MTERPEQSDAALVRAARAGFLDIPLGTAKSLIHRAREKLRGALGAYATEEVTPMVKEVFDRHRLPAEFPRKVIRGLEEVRWGAGEKENSVMGALEAALRSIGDETPYAFLMGVSGAAFRLQMEQPDWCPSAPHANCGFNCVDAALAALDYERVPIGGPDDGEERVPKAARALIASIDRGVPVFYSHEEESLVVGYEKDGEQVLLRPYAAGKAGYTPVKLVDLLSSWAGLAVLEKKQVAPDRRRSLVRSLEIASELAHTPRFGKYASGFAAYDFWVETLRDASRFDDEKKRQVANGHCYYSLCDARGAAHVYLRGTAEELGGDAAEPLRRAADLYAEIEALLRDPCPTEIAPMPWMLSAGESWTQEQRERQAEILERVAATERRAVAELESALASARKAEVGSGADGR